MEIILSVTFFLVIEIRLSMAFILVIEIRLSMTTFPVRRVIPELPHNYWNISVEREANKARSLMTVVVQSLKIG